MRCFRCATPYRPGQKFCGECGATLATAPRAATYISPDHYTPKHLAEKILLSRDVLEGERKQVTILFADIKGSLELLADRDPEEARQVLDPILDRMMEGVHHYEGIVNQVMGDGIMAIFGAPVAHEDHAIRAGCALHSLASSPRGAECSGTEGRGQTDRGPGAARTALIARLIGHGIPAFVQSCRVGLRRRP